MSRNHSQDGVFLDTGLLRDHVSKLREERKLALRLREAVVSMRMVSDPTVAYQYNSVLRDIDQLIEYFGRMAKLLDDVDDEAVALSLRLRAIIEEDTESAHRTIERAILL